MIMVIIYIYIYIYGSESFESFLDRFTGPFYWTSQGCQAPLCGSGCGPLMPPPPHSAQDLSVFGLFSCPNNIFRFHMEQKLIFLIGSSQPFGLNSPPILFDTTNPEAHTYTHLYTHIHRHARIHTHTSVYIYRTPIHSCTHTDSTLVYPQPRLVGVFVFVHTHTLTHTLTHILSAGNFQLKWKGGRMKQSYIYSLPPTMNGKRK